MRAMRAVLILGCVGLVAGCAQKLRDLDTYRGEPEEFAIVPNKPLETPQSFAALPAPTQGANRADVTPLQDAVAALGGDPARLVAGGVPASDAALVAAVGRNGITPGVRDQLAQEDAAFRRRKSILNWRLVRDNEYNKAYSAQSLDPQDWLARVRRPGTNIATPSAPPPDR